MRKENVLLVILDGWGHGKNPETSALEKANTPFVDSLYKKYPNSELITFGEEVGLPDGQMGNSEVGHMNIGAGRVVYQELARINKAIRDKTLHQHAGLVAALKKAKAENRAVHFMGLVSDGGVHSHINHLKALCEMAEEHGPARSFIHAFTDGRDVDPKSGIDFIRDLNLFLENKQTSIASITGRYYAMDRDKRWERIKLAYDALVNGIGTPTTDLETAIQTSYNNEITDEFIKPIIAVDQQQQPLATITENDLLICFNFRTDRPRQISTVLTQEDFPEFGMKKLNLHYLTMTSYDEKYKGIEVLFTKENLTETLGEVIAKAGKTQVRIAETEKYPHVTYFFSGGQEDKFEGEDRIMVASPKVATYDLQPEMSAQEVTDSIIKKIDTDLPNFICLNYANTDMVGHTGIFEAAILAAEKVDTCLEQLVATALQQDYAILVIADHGNSDMMINPDGSPNTAHTTNLVPCFLLANKLEDVQLVDGKLGDIAPTILSILGIEKPAEMTGNNLITTG